MSRPSLCSPRTRGQAEIYFELRKGLERRLAWYEVERLQGAGNAVCIDGGRNVVPFGGRHESVLSNRLPHGYTGIRAASS